MNKKADFNIQGMMLGLLVFGLFFALYGLFFSMLSGGYDIEGANQTQLNRLNTMRNISTETEKIRSDIDTVVVDRNVFDFFSDIFNKVVTPFKFSYKIYVTLKDVSGYAVSVLKLLKPFEDFFATAITIIVVVGIVMFSIYLNKRK